MESIMAISKKAFVIIIGALIVMVPAVRELAFHVKLIAPPPDTALEFTQKPATTDTVALISIKTPVSALINKANAVLPTRFSDSESDPTNWLTDDTSSFSIYRKDVRGSIDGNRLRLDIPLYNGTATIKGVFGVKRKNKGFLGDLEKLASKKVSGSVKDIDGIVTVLAAPTLTPNWTIKPNASININITNAEIKVVGNKIASVRGLVEKKINEEKKDILQDMNNLLSRSQLIKEPVAKLWEKGFITQRLDSDESAWLVITPTKVISSPITFHNGTIDIGVGISASTKILHQIEVPDNPITELPLLDITSTITPGVNLNLPIAINYKLLNDAFKRNIESLKIESDGYEIVLNDVEIEANGDKLVAIIEVTGKSNWWEKTTATVNVLGRPHLDADRNELSVVELEFDARSKDILVNSAAWLLKPIILEKLSEALYVDLSEVEREVVKKASKELESLNDKIPSEVALQANIEAFKLTDLRLTPDVMYLVVGATGSVTLSASELEF